MPHGLHPQRRQCGPGLNGNGRQLPHYNENRGSLTYDVLFVCAGNIGRSPLAEVMARRFLAQALGVGDDELEANGIRVLSASTLAPPGVQASARATSVAKEIGITIGKHPSRRLNKEMAAEADVIFCA